MVLKLIPHLDLMIERISAYFLLQWKLYGCLVCTVSVEQWKELG